jgi:hypothetical protein
VLYRDAIDLAMMIECWGQIPDAAISKAQAAYGADALGSLAKVAAVLSTKPDALADAMAAMGMDAALRLRITDLLVSEVRRIGDAMRPAAAKHGASPSPQKGENDA